MTRIVVVDDDPDIRALVAMKLTNAGYAVTAEPDGEAGLARALAEQPDLVVLDWMMPGLSGIEVCRALRDDPRTLETAVLLLTARAQEEDIDRGFAAGADDYLVKPFSVRELGNRVDALLARVRSARSVGQAPVQQLMISADTSSATLPLGSGGAPNIGGSPETSTVRTL